MNTRLLLLTLVMFALMPFAYADEMGTGKEDSGSNETTTQPGPDEETESSDSEHCGLWEVLEDWLD